MLVFPYSLKFFGDTLEIISASMTLVRYDEMSGTGDGRMWSSELAPPLWQAELSLASVDWSDARRINARIRALAGTEKSLMWSDPTYAPEFAPSDNPTLASIAADKSAISISNLRPNYSFNAGDMLSFTWEGGTRHYLGEVAEDISANASGTVAALSVYPYVPMSAAVGVRVELVRPSVEMIIPPDGFTPYRFLNDRAEGASIKMLQKL